VYNYSFGSEDSLVTKEFKEFGFSLKYPSAYNVTSRTQYSVNLLLNMRDSALAFVVVHHPFVFFLEGDEIGSRIDIDSALCYARSESLLPIPHPFVVDGDHEFTEARIDSTKLFISDGSLRVIVVYQTYVTEKWDESVPQVRTKHESRIAPFFWVDLCTPSRKVMLEIRVPEPAISKSGSNELVVALVNSVKRLR
jgi:hypothetical protein